MAAAFLPQFGCFARSQINALDRHGRSCWRSASCHLRVRVFSLSILKIGKIRLVVRWSKGGVSSERDGEEGGKKKERFESGTGWDYEIMFYER